MPHAEGTAPANPIVSAILAGSAPRPLKISAARGVLPLLKAELVRILVALLDDADDQVSREARSKLASFSEGEIRPMLEDISTPVEVLDHFGCDLPGAPSLKTSVMANPATPIETLRRMAFTISAESIDSLLLNLTRLIASPDLLDLLASNPALTAPQRTRISEIRRHFLDTSSTAEAAPAEPVGPSPGDTDATAILEAEPAAGEPAASEISAPAAETDAILAHAAQRILRMNISEKIQLALKGTREERSILVRDTSRSVQEAVMESPKLTDSEVEGFARMKSLSEDVLRMIAANREWVKNYSVVQALATNPKTPPAIAMNMVARLHSRDLKVLAGDRNVPEVIRRQARKVADSRNQGPRAR